MLPYGKSSMPLVPGLKSPSRFSRFLPYLSPQVEARSPDRATRRTEGLLPGILSGRGDIWGRASAVAIQSSLPPDKPGGGEEGGYCPRSGCQTSLRRDKPAGGGNERTPAILRLRVGL